MAWYATIPQRTVPRRTTQAIWRFSTKKRAVLRVDRICSASLLPWVLMVLGASRNDAHGGAVGDDRGPLRDDAIAGREPLHREHVVAEDVAELHVANVRDRLVVRPVDHE